MDIAYDIKQLAISITLATPKYPNSSWLKQQEKRIRLCLKILLELELDPADSVFVLLQCQLDSVVKAQGRMRAN